MASHETFELSLPTSQTKTGPYIRYEGTSLKVEYDFERDDGGIEWTKVVFNSVVKFEYRQNICCRAEDLDAYNKVVRYEASEWQAEALELQERFLGSSGLETRAPFVHWRMYFDDVGCLDVLALSFEIKKV